MPAGGGLRSPLRTLEPEPGHTGVGKRFMTIQIRLNGELKSIPENLDLAQLLAQLQVNSQKVAVAKNLEVVLRSELVKTTLCEGDEIEIFQAV